jgi:hypothetical protein
MKEAHIPFISEKNYVFFFKKKPPKRMSHAATRLYF